MQAISVLLVLFPSPKEGSGGDLIVALLYLKGAYREDGEKPFIMACRMKGNGSKRKEGRFRPDIRKKFFTMKMVRH